MKLINLGENLLQKELDNILSNEYYKCFTNNVHGNEEVKEVIDFDWIADNSVSELEHILAKSI